MPQLPEQLHYSVRVERISVVGRVERVQLCSIDSYSCACLASVRSLRPNPKPPTSSK